MRGFSLALPSAEGGGGASMRIDAPDDLYIPRVLQFGGLSAYEPETLGCFLACAEVAGDGVVFDVGANVGVFSWLAGACAQRTAIAYEPAPKVAACLRGIAEANELPIEVAELALSDAPGEAEFYISDVSDCSSSLSSEFRNAASTLTVRVDTVDGERRRVGKRVALLKLDTETTEPAVLRGARTTVESDRPWIICEVLAEDSEQELMAFFAQLDYHWYQITDESPLVRRREIFGERAQVYRNWLFAPEVPAESFWVSMKRWKDALRACVPLSRDVAVDAAALQFTAPAGFDTRWRPVDRPSFKARLDGDGAVIHSELPAGQRVYFFHGGSGFDDVAPATERVDVTGGGQYRLELDAHGDEGGTPGVHLWVFRYDGRARIGSDRAYIRPGANRLTFDTEPSARSIRIAYRITGPGAIRLGPIRLYHLQGT